MGDNMIAIRTGVAVVATAGLVVLTGCSTTTDSTTNEPKSTKTATPAKPKATAADELNDDSWDVAAINLKDDGLGDFGGSIRLTNTKKNTRSGVYTLTVFKKNKQVGSLQGSSNDVEGGKTVTVQLISSDKYVGGPYTYDFQTDL